MRQQADLNAQIEKHMRDKYSVSLIFNYKFQQILLF